MTRNGMKVSVCFMREGNRPKKIPVLNIERILQKF